MEKRKKKKESKPESDHDDYLKLYIVFRVHFQITISLEVVNRQIFTERVQRPLVYTIGKGAIYKFT